MSDETERTIKIPLDDILNQKDGTVIPKEVMEKAVMEFSESLKDNPIPGFFTGGSRELENATHIVEDVSTDDGFLKARIGFIDTPRGNVLRKLIDLPGVRFEPSMHASCTKLTDGTVMVDEIYNIDSIDMCLFDVGKK